jgi:hypothetical protein
VPVDACSSGTEIGYTFECCMAADDEIDAPVGLAASAESQDSGGFEALHAALGEGRPASRSRSSHSRTSVPVGESPSEHVAESSGRANAAYASGRPRALRLSQPPPTLGDVPAVIVAPNDTIPSLPPRMTVPLALTANQLSFHPSLKPPAASAPSFAPDPRVSVRHPRALTQTVRARGPSVTSQVLVFLLILVLVVACGAAVIAVRQPAWFFLAPRSAAE